MWKISLGRPKIKVATLGKYEQQVSHFLQSMGQGLHGMTFTYIRWIASKARCHVKLKFFSIKDLVTNIEDAVLFVWCIKQLIFLSKKQIGYEIWLQQLFVKHKKENGVLYVRYKLFGFNLYNMIGPWKLWLH